MSSSGDKVQLMPLWASNLILVANACMPPIYKLLFNYHCLMGTNSQKKKKQGKKKKKKKKRIQQTIWSNPSIMRKVTRGLHDLLHRGHRYCIFYLSLNWPLWIKLRYGSVWGMSREGKMQHLIIKVIRWRILSWRCGSKLGLLHIFG